MAKKSISLSYESFPKKDPNTGKIIGERFYPLIRIKIKYGQLYSRIVPALVDSGSDRNLFPAQMAESLGVDFSGQKPDTISGVGGTTKAYAKKVRLCIIGLDYKTINEYEVEADFSYDQQMPLLGREGFFDLFEEVTFNQKTKFLDIKI